MRSLGAVFGLLSKLTPGNADDPICLSSSDDEAPPPRSTQPQRRPSALSSKAKGKQKADDDGNASDASRASDTSIISITDILNSSQNAHTKSKSKSGTPKAGEWWPGKTADSRAARTQFLLILTRQENLRPDWRL